MRWLFSYCNCAVLHQTISNVPRYELTFTANINSCFKKASQNRGLSEPLKPPLVMA